MQWPKKVVEYSMLATCRKRTSSAGLGGSCVIEFDLSDRPTAKNNLKSRFIRSRLRKCNFFWQPPRNDRICNPSSSRLHMDYCSSRALFSCRYDHRTITTCGRAQFGAISQRARVINETWFAAVARSGRHVSSIGL